MFIVGEFLSKKIFTIYIILIFLLLQVNFSLAQDTTFDKNKAVTEQISTPSPKDSSTIFPTDQRTTSLTEPEIQMTLGIIIFGILIFIMEFLLIKSGKIHYQDSTKILIVTLIIISTLILITAGYSNNQIAPAVGLLGTIAGYLLGRTNTENKPEKNE